MTRRKSAASPAVPAPAAKYVRTEQEQAAVDAYLARQKARAPFAPIKIEAKNGVASITSNHPDEGTAQAMQLLGLGVTTAGEFNLLIKQAINLTATEGGADEQGANELLSIVAGIGPTNTVEGLLALQMAAIHKAAIHAATALRKDSSIDVAAYRAKTLNNLTRTFAIQAETLKKLRSTGEQKVVVEHKHYHLAAGTIADGAQAVLGDVTGATGGLLENGGQSHERMLLSERAAMLGTIQTDGLPVQGTRTDR